MGKMRRSIVPSLAMLLAVTTAGAYSHAQEAEAPAGGAVTPHIEACATDPDKLGISRVVEIDEAGGPEFGGPGNNANDFLNDGEVIFTFDDGPLRHYTRPVLKALAAHCTKATFFMVGRMAAADPAMVKEVAAAGHTVGSHTWSHKNLRPLSLIKGRQELEAGLSAVAKANGAPIAPFFRFPFLATSRQVTEYAKSRNIAMFLVDIDSKDYQTRDPKLVHKKIMSQLLAQRKGIILMHDIQPSTAAVMKGLLVDLHKRGFRIVHMVPKAPAPTLAEFDDGASRAVAAKARKKQDEPLADRTMVWTMAPPGKAAVGALPSQPKPTKRTVASDGDPGEKLPWTPPASKKAAEPRPVKPAKQQPQEELPWQMRIFNY